MPESFSLASARPALSLLIFLQSTLCVCTPSISLGDNEKECPGCASEYRSVLEMKRSLEQNSKDQDQFFRQVKSSKHGFFVMAGYFGKGIICKTSDGLAGKLGSTSSSSGF